jgi:hypothetical protein
VKLQFKKRRLIPAALAILVLVVGSGVAYAYWTAGGTGSGNAAAANSVSNVTVNQTTVLTAMFPGDIAQTISGNFTNTNAAPTYVTTVTASISSVTKAGGAVTGTCDSTDFTLGSPAVTVAALVPVGSPELTLTWTGPTLHFNNKATNQDQCKGATVALTYTIS